MLVDGVGTASNVDPMFDVDANSLPIPYSASAVNAVESADDYSNTWVSNE